MKTLLLCLLAIPMFGVQKIIIWDNDGTIMGSKDPHDTTSAAKVILPNVATTMRQKNTLNIICSGMKTPESESQNFDPEKIIAKFTTLMLELPISIAVFSPAIGGTQCWALIKEADNQITIFKAHEDERYRHLIGTFKKPDIGMLVVIKELLREKGIVCDGTNTVFIGDAWQDMKAAHGAQLPFLHAKHIHGMSYGT
jgi:histidinol phosphatase-like enzyme